MPDITPFIDDLIEVFKASPALSSSKAVETDIKAKLKYIFDQLFAQELPTFTPITITRAALATAITNSTLTVGAFYAISDSAQGGMFIVKALAVNKVDTKGTWIRNTDLKPFGWIRLTGGGSGSVNSITVDGDEKMSAAVNFNTSLENTATLVAANITANSGSNFGWTAIAVNDVVVLIGPEARADFNGLVVAGTGTTITLGNAQNITNGQEPSPQALEVSYNAATDKLTSVYDSVRNNKVEMSEIQQGWYSVDPFNLFRWGDDAYLDNYALGGYFKDNYFVGEGTFSNHVINGLGFVRKTIGISGAFLGSNNLYCNSHEIDGFIESISLLASGAYLYNCDISAPFKNISITAATCSVYGVKTGKVDVGNLGGLRRIKINGTGSDIKNCVFSGEGSGLSDIDFGGQTAVNVEGLYLEGLNARFASITFDATSKVLQYINWTTDNRVIYNIVRTGLTNTANNGAAGSDIYLGYLPVAKIFPTKNGYIEASGIAGGGDLTVGIETDAEDCIVSATPATSFNGAVTDLSILYTPTKSTVANRRIVGNFSSNATAGAIQLTLEFKISAF